MKIQSRRAMTITALAAATGAATLGSMALAQSSQEGQSGRLQEIKVEARKPKLILVKFHADWCPICRALEPAWEDANERMAADDILFVRLDRTDKRTSRQSAFHMATLGIPEAWRTYSRQNGLMVLFDTETGEKLEVFSGRTAGESVAEKIREYL